MSRPVTHTDEQIADALRGSGGVVAHAAGLLGLARQTLSKKIRGNQMLLDARQEGRDAILDKAESELFVAVRAGKAWAVKFTLSRLGRERGYGASVRVDGDVQGKVVVYLPDDGRENPETFFEGI